MITRARRAAALLEKLRRGPSISALSFITPDISADSRDAAAAVAREHARLWLQTWIVPEVEALLKGDLKRAAYARTEAPR